MKAAGIPLLLLLALLASSASMALGCRCLPELVQSGPVCGGNGRNYDNACAPACAGVQVVSNGRCRLTLPQLPTLPTGFPTFPDIAFPTGKRKLLALALRPGISEGCICPAVFAPVCGTDGHQYSNSCEARCAGVAVVSDNHCNIRPLFPILSDFPELVDTSFPTAGKRKLVAVAVDEGCICPAGFQPVCGADSRQYGNSCKAGCAGVAVVSDFVPPGGCHILGGGGASFPTRPQFPSLSDFPTFPDISFPGGKRKLQAAADEGCVCIALSKPVCGADGRQYSNACQAGCANVTVVTDFVPPGGCRGVLGGGGASFPTRPQFPSLSDFITFPDISLPTGKRKLQ